MTRLVVVLTGPPGCGKSTLAHASGLDVYDRDDPQWDSEAAFRQAISQVGHDPDARAVVIRTAATTSARAKWRAIAQATHCYRVPYDIDECARRIRTRARPTWRRELAALRQWLDRADTTDHVPDFPGWDNLGPASTPPQRFNAKKRGTTPRRGYGHRHRKTRAHWQARMDAGEVVLCWRCGQPITGEWDLGHDDDDRSIYRGPEHVGCNRRAGSARANRVRWSTQAADQRERTRERGEPPSPSSRGSSGTEVAPLSAQRAATWSRARGPR